MLRHVTDLGLLIDFALGRDILEHCIRSVVHAVYNISHSLPAEERMEQRCGRSSSHRNDGRSVHRRSYRFLRIDFRKEENVGRDSAKA